MNIQARLPKNLEKTISEFARAREKAAKQTYMLQVSESLVMHLCAFVLGEYKDSGLTNVPLEKSFIRNNRNLAFGIYVGWLRDTSKFLNTGGKPSQIDQLLNGRQVLPELAAFNSFFESLKELVAKGSDHYQEAIPGSREGVKTSLMEFFNSIVQLRNRIAHPHMEVNGKTVSWPFTEEYFDIINPCLERALERCINELSKVWEFRQFIIESNEDGSLTLKDEDSGEVEEIAVRSGLPQGVKVLADAANNLLLSDWKLLLKAGEATLQEIRKEEEALRNKATVEELKSAIITALDDEQISVDEMNFFESLGKTKLGLSREDVRNMIFEVARSMGIANPFPEVDKRFIELIDQAILTRTYNEFLLKLTAQQYGVTGDAFDKVFLERSAALNTDPEVVRSNKVIQFSKDELTAFQGLMNTWKWMMGLSSFRDYTKDLFKIKEDSYTFGTKEYWHRTAFLAVEVFVRSRLKKLTLEEELTWDTRQNLWQQGNLSGYAWCIIYPKDLPSRKLLALGLTINREGQIGSSFLPDWKDIFEVADYGLLLNVFKEHLKSFARDFEQDLEKYPNLRLHDPVTSNNAYSFAESIRQFPWFYDHCYEFNYLGIHSGAEEIMANPSIVTEQFDIIFNLFKGLFEAVNRDYLNMLDGSYLIKQEEREVRNRLLALNPLLNSFGLENASREKENEDEMRNKDDGDSMEEVTDDDIQSSSDGLKGSAHKGMIFKEISSKVKGYPMAISFMIRQDYFNNRLNYLILVSCAGYHEPAGDAHFRVEQVLMSLQGLTFPNAEFHFMRSKFLVRVPIGDITGFDPAPVTEFFLNAMASACAEMATPFLELRLNDARLAAFAGVAADVLDRLHSQLGAEFRNGVVRQRDFMRGMRYLDLVSSSKKVRHYTGWGLFHENGRIHAGITFHVADSLAGAMFMEQMRNTAAANPSWEFFSKAEPAEASWIMAENLGFQYSSSTDYNSRYQARHALLSNDKTCWCAKKVNEKQWWQVELPEPMTILGLKLGGAPNGKYHTTRFNLSYSSDNRNWNTVESIEGLAQANEIRAITLETPVTAKFIRLNPVEYEGMPALRVDLLARKITQSEIELRWLVPVERPEDLTDAFSTFSERLAVIKAFKGLGF